MYLKKLVLFWISIVLLFSLVGCRSIVDKNNESFSEAVEKITTDTVDLNDLTNFQ